MLTCEPRDRLKPSTADPLRALVPKMAEVAGFRCVEWAARRLKPGGVDVRPVTGDMLIAPSIKRRPTVAVRIGHHHHCNGLLLRRHPVEH